MTLLFFYYPKLICANPFRYCWGLCVLFYLPSWYHSFYMWCLALPIRDDFGGEGNSVFFFIFSTLLHMYLRTFCSYFFKHTNISSVYNLSFCSKTLCPLVIYVFPELWCSYHYSNKCARQVRMHATTFSTGGFASSTLNRRAKKMTLKRSFTNLHELWCWRYCCGLTRRDVKDCCNLD